MGRHPGGTSSFSEIMGCEVIGGAGGAGRKEGSLYSKLIKKEKQNKKKKN